MKKLLLTKHVLHATTLHENPENKHDGYKLLAIAGDALLKFHVIEFLLEHLPNNSVGELTLFVSKAVSNDNLSSIFAKIQDRYKIVIHKGTGSSQVTLSKDDISVHTKGNIIEALIYATFLDNQLEIHDELISFITATINLNEIPTVPARMLFRDIVLKTDNITDTRKFFTTEKKSDTFTVTLNYLSIEISAQGTSKKKLMEEVCVEWISKYQKTQK